MGAEELAEAAEAAAQVVADAAAKAATLVEEAADKASEGLKGAGRWLARAAGGLAVAAGLLAIAATVILVTAIILIRKADDDSRIAKQSRAETRYLLCSRGDELIEPVKLDDVHLVCDRYKTLEQAYQTEGVRPRYS